MDPPDLPRIGGAASYEGVPSSAHTTMPKFVPVLTPTADGQAMSLDPGLLEMLREENTEKVPVVVLTILGPRSDDKSKLLSDLHQTIAGGAEKQVMGPGPVTTQTERAKSAAEATEALPMETEDSDGLVPGAATHSAAAPADGCVGAAGVAAWSQLLPVELPEGGRAALLLLDAWGPLERDCPAQLRTSVTLLSALVSSSLVVHTSAGFPVQPLDDLLLLGKLSAAAHEVRHCMPLQQLVLLLRDWPGPAPPGLQDDFKPLYQWADSSSDAKQALHVMMDTTDLYDMGDAALFLAAGRTPRDDVTPEHVKMLAKVRAVKRFGEKDITAGELADYLESLGSALNATQCDAYSLIRALVDANQTLAAQSVQPIYKKKMEELEKSWGPGPVSEQDVQGAHDRAAHEALIAFSMCQKMDSEKMDSEKAKQGLQKWLDRQYRGKWEKIQDNIKKMDEEACKTSDQSMQLYEKGMREALNDSPQMTIADLIKTHETLKGEVVSKMRTGRYSESQRCMEMSEKLESLFRQFAAELEEAQLKEEEDKANRSHLLIAEQDAERLYRFIMEKVQLSEISAVHGRLQECAKLKFDSKTKDLEVQQRSEAHKRLETATDRIRKELSQAHNTQPDGTMHSPIPSGHMWPDGGATAGLHMSANAGFGAGNRDFSADPHHKPHMGSGATGGGYQDRSRESHRGGRQQSHPSTSQVMHGVIGREYEHEHYGREESAPNYDQQKSSRIDSVKHFFGFR